MGILRGRHHAHGPKQRFHRLSVVAWAVWLVPYLSGVIFGMGGGTR